MYTKSCLMVLYAETPLHVGGGTSKEDFVKMREERDAGLSVPKLLLIALNYNLRAGKTPPAEANGRSYVKLPIGFFGED